ncbi:MAG: tol-pal system-associated acyl-CoA thioesterase [Ferrovum sp.]|nr:tol-pal system-associated acyl-CoA thioesterase [Ferrovum sp.]NDU87268.1 tol-pal system-associated acyl-CoA thioesterase [Ferrovum sp.]
MNAYRAEVSLRIYHEDTDAGGVVYHANYLRYMERARTEWLQSTGFNHDRVAQELGVLFVVRQVDMKYLRPARLGDDLVARAELVGVRHGLMRFDQRVSCKEHVLVRAQVTVACVRLSDFTVAAIPATLLSVLGVEG